MPVQDDARESQMIQLFNLTVPEERRRSDIDAHLNIDGKVIDFELKSTTSDSVSTVRDFGPEHIRKWRADLHWIFAFYDKSGTKLLHCIYASPADMEPWIAEKERYIRPDLLVSRFCRRKDTAGERRHSPRRERRVPRPGRAVADEETVDGCAIS